MRRTLWCLVAYTPHLMEEALTGMWRDPILAPALAPLSRLAPQQSAYLVFQAMVFFSLAMTHLASLGGRYRRAVELGLSFSMLAESHHFIRAVVTHSGNSGLVTSIPIPIVGLLVLHSVLVRPKAIPS
jgi:hypothetical protein